MASGCFLLLALTRQTNHPLNIPISSRSAMTHQNAIYAYENVSFTSWIWFETHDHITEEDCCLECSHCSTPFFKPVLMTFVFYNPCMSIVLWIYAKGQSYLCVNKLSKKNKKQKGNETTDFARSVVLHLSGDFMSAVSILTNLSSSLLCTLGYQSDYISS